MRRGIAILALVTFASPAFAKCDEPGPQRDGSSCQIVLRFELSNAAALDAWIAKQPDPKPSREEAIRQLLAEGSKGAK